MEERLVFSGREDFRNWLQANCLSKTGVWLLFGKKGGPKTVSAGQALEEALCFGWIDGQMRKIDETQYQKYFAPRRANSRWSEKNKALAERLEKQGAMTEQGRAKIQEAKRSGRWEAPKPTAVTEEQVEALAALLRGQEPACTNFLSMSMSVQKTYARAYFDARTDAGRERRWAWMIGRLNKGQKPM